MSIVIPSSNHLCPPPPDVRTKMRALTEWVEREEDDERAIHETLIREVATLLHADGSAALCPMFAPDGGWSSDYVHALDLVTGRVLDDDVRAALAAASAERFSPVFPLKDANRDRVLHATLETQRRFDDFEISEIEKQLFSADFAGLGMALTDGGVCVGWLCFLSYEDRFAPWAGSVLAELMPVLRKRLALEQRIRSQRIAGAGLDLALEALVVPAYILVGARPVHANHAGQAWLDVDRVAVREALRRGLAGDPEAPFAVSERRLPGMPPVVLAVQRRPAEPASIDEVARVYGLTPREREVLDLLARGLPNKVIAAKLSRALRTIEVHVSSLLKKTAAKSRTELVIRLHCRG